MSALIELRSVADALIVLERIRDDLIRASLSEGHSEREVGRAANVSGPAINQRKKAIRTALDEDQHG